MTVKSTPPPDDAWCGRAKFLWEKTLPEFALESHHLELLRAACQQLTRAEQARAAVEKNGVIVADRFGQPKENPAVAIERQAHLAYLRLLRELGLDIEPPETRGPRRPGTGV